LEQTQERTQKHPLRGSAVLLVTAIIWGVAFVAQSAGMEYIGAFTFNALRHILGMLVLLPVIRIRDNRSRRGQKGTDPAARPEMTQDMPAVPGWPVKGGAVCGCLLFAASNLQQSGIRYTTVGKAGFITALYILIVPLLGIFRHRRIGRRLIISVLLALAGLYLLCMKEQLSLQYGDWLVLLCAFAFSLQIMAVDYYSEICDPVKLACIQFGVCALLSGLAMLAAETVSAGQIRQALLPILYAGILSTGVGYTFQIIGQRELDPTIASLIMSLESVISALAGWVLLGQQLSAREITGCAVMFAAIILAQLPERTAKGAHSAQ